MRPETPVRRLNDAVVDAVVAGAGELHVSGWALDRVVDVSVPVSVYVDGNPKVTSIATPMTIALSTVPSPGH